MTNLLNYTFITNAIIVSLLSSIICGFLGTYIVSKRMVFISGGITHASFGGIGLAFYFGFLPFAGAIIFAIISALSIEYLTKKGNIRNDSTIGILWSLGMAIGIIFIYLTPGYTPNLMSYLFGSVLAISKVEIIFMAILTLIVIVFFLMFYNKILFIAFDYNFAKSQKAPVSFINYTTMLLIALTIVINIRIAGIILVMSMLTIPQNTANLFTNKFKHIIIYSIITGFIGTLIGLYLSFNFNIPSGGAIIITLSAIFFIAKIAKKLTSIYYINKTCK